MAEPAAGAGGAVAAAVARVDPGFRPDPAGLVPGGLTDRARRNLTALDTLARIDATGVVDLPSRWASRGGMRTFPTTISAAPAIPTGPPLPRSPSSAQPDEELV